MARIVRLAHARDDALAIWLYIARNNEPAAERLLQMIDNRLLLLANNPELGRERPDIAEGLRYFPVGKYLILYRALTDGVEVVRLVHGAQNLEALDLE